MNFEPTTVPGIASILATGVIFSIGFQIGKEIYGEIVDVLRSLVGRKKSPVTQ